MSYVIAAAGLFSLAAPAPAADKPKPNTLNRSEVADGWLLLFDGESTFGWRAAGDVRAAGGELVLGGAGPTKVTLPLTAFELRADFQNREGIGTTNLVLDWGSTTAGTVSTTIFSGVGKETAWSTLRVKVEYDPALRGRATTMTLKSSFESGKAGSYENTLIYGSQGLAAVRLELPAGTKLALRNVKLRPLATKPLFNGKDLAGWKKYEGDAKRSKSQFTVTKEGWLHLKDGPGDLQTEGQWADFVLQLECRTGGKYLNSGAFFRCLPGQYQNGYEAQIHNNFTADPPKEYAVDEYDARTHAKKGAVKVKSAATDYGTGAIYRRVPARTGVARDGEWFTMTVVAHGRHIATWVNGVQQVDWTDDRPPHENPRNGCRVEKGAISLQGHDATTDLHFRNIRLAELPAAK